MQPDRATIVRLWDMLDACRSILDKTEGLTYEAFLDNDTLQDAIQFKLIVIGEAASKIPKLFREAHAKIPWHKIVKQRNIVAHHYDIVSPERIWDVVTLYIHELVEQLEAILPSPPDEPEL